MIGRTVSHYEIVEQIGEGGMGVVYKARDTVLPRHVALKVLPLQDADSNRRQRFLREAKTSSTLNHPHIITIHDVVSDDDADYIVMEYIDGETLHQRLRAGALPIADALRFAIEAAGAVGAAHGAGIIHRDLKPANLMIGESGHIKVLDFGLARLTSLTEINEDDKTATVERTRTGTVLGTFSYMSPEQTRGETVDERSDIFSFGVVLYEMLTGERPFRGGNPVSTMQKIALSEPRPPAELRTDLPNPVGTIVHRALAKERDDRYQSMEELVADLNAAAAAVVSTDEVVLPSGTTRESAVAASGSGASPGSVAYAGVTAPATPAVAPAPMARVSKVAVPLLVIAAIAYAGRDRLPWFGAGDEAASGASVATPSTPFEHYQAGLAYLERFDRPGYIEEALDSFQRAIGLDDEYAPAYAGYAQAAWHRYWFRPDEVWLQRARNNAERAVQLGPLLSFPRAVLAQILIDQGELDEAESHIAAALVADPDSVEAHSAQAYLRDAHNDFEGAEREHQLAVTLRPDDWRLHNNLGDFYFRQGYYDEALAPFEESIRLTPDNSIAYRDLGAAHQQLGDFAKASSELQRSLEIRPSVGAYSNLATLYFQQSMFQQAVDTYKLATELDASDYILWGNLGDALRWTPDNVDDANDAYTRAIQLVDPQLAENPDDYYLRSLRALYLADSGRNEEALADLALIDWADSDNLGLMYRMIKAYESAEDRDTALAVLEAVLERGLSIRFIIAEPEFTDLRADVRYHRIAARFSGN